MTRINTNISSLVAQTRLSRTNQDLQVALTRLSTGLRVNTGKDDPAGLIASESLRSDITAMNKAISNTQRAVQIIATADSALGQVSSLLNTMRGLIVEAANVGALSDDEIAANQLQIDSSLDAINRIAQTTTFQGRKLFDGSLDFITNISSITQITDAKIEQANLGATGSMNVEVVVEAAATQAELTNSAFSTANATSTLRFSSRSAAVLGDIRVSATSETQPVTITFQDDNVLAVDTVEATYNATTRTILVRGNGSTTTSITKGQVAAAINGLAEFDAIADALTTTDPAGDFTNGGLPPLDEALTTPSIQLQADLPGQDFNNVAIVFEAAASTSATYSPTAKTITVGYVPGTTTISQISTAIDALAEVSVIAINGGTQETIAGDVLVEGNTGSTGGGVLRDSLVFELTGAFGTQPFNFPAGTSVDQIASAVNLLSDAVGVTAEVDSATGFLEFHSSTYGSKSVVGVTVIAEGPNGLFRQNLSDLRSVGTDVRATVNGFRADGDGNRLSLITSTLTMELTLDPSQVANTLRFTISGGGALFQLGGDVVSNQQARLGINSLSTSTLGGPSGRLYELGQGQGKSLRTDILAASRIVNEVITKVTSLRGRMGAFQATTLESNEISLSDTISNLTEAESYIRDADFARETAQLTRSQILVQSGTTVLGIANQNPQNVLSLLQR